MVADLIQVKKQYETAIETALSSNVQNIVTEDEETAKQMIRYLKENRYGRATFLPLTSVGKKKNRAEIMRQSGKKGVIGYADHLVSNDKKYDGIMAYLLGRVLVIDTIDHAVVIAKNTTIPFIW